MIAHVSAFGAGLPFGIGLWLSGMANPRKVLDFLDFTGNWDPSLLLVMGGAVAVTMVAFRRVTKRPKPLAAPRFLVPTSNVIDAPLLIGAALFGPGLGCRRLLPGPRAHGNLQPDRRGVRVRRRDGLGRNSAPGHSAARVARGPREHVKLRPSPEGSLAQR